MRSVGCEPIKSLLLLPAGRDRQLVLLATSVLLDLN